MGFEDAIPANERPQTHALDRAAIGISATLHPENYPGNHPTGGWVVVRSGLKVTGKIIRVLPLPECKPGSSR